MIQIYGKICGVTLLQTSQIILGFVFHATMTMYVPPKYRLSFRSIVAIVTNEHLHFCNVSMCQNDMSVDVSFVLALIITLSATEHFHLCLILVYQQVLLKVTFVFTLIITILTSKRFHLGYVPVFQPVLLEVALVLALVVAIRASEQFDIIHIFMYQLMC